MSEDDTADELLRKIVEVDERILATEAMRDSLNSRLAELREQKEKLEAACGPIDTDRELTRHGRLLVLATRLDEGEGVEKEALVDLARRHGVAAPENALIELEEEGEVYQPTDGVVKVTP
jgi:hypothetical protein